MQNQLRRYLGRTGEEIMIYDYEKFLVCPKCGSEEVTLTHVQTFMANTGDHYCHSIKTHDANSPADCIECGWEGERLQLKTAEWKSS